MRMRSNQIKKAWEERSNIFSNSKKAVMEQSFPSEVLAYFHKKHTEEILNEIPKKKFRCLDVGCGYGRIAREIVAANPSVFIDGIDISSNFVDQFNANIKSKGKAKVGNVKELPYKSDLFDVVIVVVTFMYLEKKKDQIKAMKEIFRVLKKGGKLIIIEPNKLGQNLVKLWGILPFVYRALFNKQKVETFGIYFRWMTIDALIKLAGGKLVGKRGYPFLTFILPYLFILGKFSLFPLGKVLDIIEFLDKKIALSRFSYVITYVAEKK